MPTMFVANATKHNHLFNYNIPGRSSATAQVIPMGGQIPSSGEFTTDQIDGIILQHEPYGFCSINELDSGNDKVFSGIFYSLEKPIPAAVIHKAMLKVGKKLVKQGEELRKQAAVSLQNQIETQIIGENNPAMSLTSLEMSVEEQAPPGGLADGQELFEEGIKVVKNPEEASVRPSRRK